MNQPSDPLLREINIDIDALELIEAIKYTDIGEESYLNPKSLDAFVISDLKNFFNIEEGNGFAVNMNFQDQNLQPKCHFLKLQNINKGQEHIMTKEDWEKCFDIKDNPNVTYVPDGSLFLKPTENNGLQSFEIITKESDTSNNDKVNYMSYTIVLSFLIDNSRCYFKIDPLVKISSKHGGGG